MLFRTGARTGRHRTLALARSADAVPAPAMAAVVTATAAIVRCSRRSGGRRGRSRNWAPAVSLKTALVVRFGGVLTAQKGLRYL
jgi:hypothetical protein